MYQHISVTKSASTTDISNNRPQLPVRPQTPGPEDRCSYSFKSLFTLADVAAKRRANVGLKKRTSARDENACGGGETMSSTFMKRSKSSGDVAMPKNSRPLNANSGTDMSKAAKLTKGLLVRAATTPPSTYSKIPKARSVAWLQTLSTSEESPGSSAIDASCDVQELNVDDAVFVLITPPQAPKKVLTLAAHTQSLPQVASPFSPRIHQPCSARPLRARSATPRSSPDNGHTTASLHLTKSHWELRYDTWTRSLSMKLPHTTANTNAQSTPTRSRFPAPLTNPALFPRAGSLTPIALRPVLDGMIAVEDARPAIEVDWAMRAWPLDKIKRALFVHDMDVRTCFPVHGSQMDYNARSVQQPEDTELEPTPVAPRQAERDVERENEHLLRRWEWDWELRWRVIEDIAQDESERAECEYDVFLAEDYTKGDSAYGGCEMHGGVRLGTMVDGDWDWSEDAMEVDGML